MFELIDRVIKSHKTYKKKHKNIWEKNVFGFADALSLKWHKTAFILLVKEKIAYNYIETLELIFYT